MKQRIKEFWENYGTPLATVIILIHTNAYRLFPTCECVPLSGDTFWYTGYLLSIIVLFSTVPRIKDSHRACATLMLSIAFNDLFDEFLGNPHELEAFEMTFHVIAAIIFCHTLKVRWYYFFIIVAGVIVLTII